MANRAVRRMVASAGSSYLSFAPAGAAGSITTVALNSGAGTLSQHAGGNLSRVKNPREMSMKLDRKKLPASRWPTDRRTSAARRYTMRPLMMQATPASERPSANDALWWPSRLMLKVVGTFAVCSDVAFHSVILSVMSWTVAQVLEGCAAYAQGMYPYVLEPDEPRGHHPPVALELRSLESRGDAENSNIAYLESRGNGRQ
ncbi:hypothetical protein [Bradyrhizobium sp. USDA 10063]